MSAGDRIFSRWVTGRRGEETGMNVKAWKRRNALRRAWVRILHPWPFYKRVGGINAVVTRANGDKEDLGQVSVTYARRWGVSTK